MIPDETIKLQIGQICQKFAEFCIDNVYSDTARAWDEFSKTTLGQALILSIMVPILGNQKDLPKDVIIVGVENFTAEGVALVLNKPAKRFGDDFESKTWWFSWDKIGGSMFPGYTDARDVATLDKLRKGGGA